MLGRSIDLTWSPPGGNAPAGYVVERGGVEIARTTGTSYADDSVTAGVTYIYDVRALDAAGDLSASSNYATATVPFTVPASPTVAPAAVGNRLVTLALGAPASVGGSPLTGYRIYRGTASGSERLLKSVGAVTSYTDTSVTNGTTYYYQASAVNGFGEGPRSPEVAATPATVPGSPGNLTISANAPSGVVLSWRASSSGGSPVSAYNIYRSTASGAETLLASTGDGTSYTDTTVANGTTYYYRVSAVNAIGEGARSGEKSARRGTVAR
jgi:fibronectin type 3 domain-containing protein